MVPQRLIIEGVYSYKKRVEIDFETLCKTRLFGIFGNVGSGKSAILEAITYVLYGEAPRLSKMRLTYNMMNLSSSKMFIEFKFTQNGKQYLFSIEAKRKKNDFTVIDTPKRNAYVWENDWIPLFDKSSNVNAEEILGLNYDNFRRTVIVPQGRFQEFLHLSGSDRTTMLMELFNLKRFDLLAKTSYLSAENSQKIAALNGAIGSLPKVDNEILAEAERELNEIEKEIEKLIKKIEKSDKLLREYEFLYSNYIEVNNAFAELEEAKKNIPDVEEQKRKLAQYEECRNNFESLIDNIELLNIEYEKKDTELKNLKERSKNCKVEIEATKAKLSLAEAKNNKTEILQKQVEWLDDLSKLTERKNTLKQCNIKKEKLLQNIKIDKEKYDVEKSQVDSLKQEAKEIAVATVDFEKITRLKNLYDAIEQKKDDYSDLEEQIVNYEEELKKIGDLQKQKEEIEEQEKMINKDFLDNEIKNQIKKLATNLKEGQACPVCGSLEHPSPAVFFTIEDTEKEDLKNLSKQKEELQIKQRQADKFKVKIETAKETAKKLNDRIIAETAERDSVFKETLIKEFASDDKVSFYNFYASYVEKSKRMNKFTSEINKYENDQAELSKKIREAEDNLNNIKIEAAGIESSIKEAENRIDKNFLNENTSKTVEYMQNQSKSIVKTIEEIKTDFAELTKHDSMLSLKNKEITTEIRFNEEHIKEILEKIEKQQKDINNLIAELNYSALSEVKNILNQKIDIKEERRRLEEFETKKISLKTRIDAAVKNMAGKTYNTEEHEKEKNKNEDLKKQNNEESGRLGAALSRLSELKKSFKQKNKLEKELTILKLTEDNLKTLKYLFKGKKFINYVATMYLKELCNAANSRFRKLTQESLRLELDENNDFIIRDYLNAGKTRSIKTLSGGQTFQAAFSLSLALADNIGKERSGFFFLDEGFGSLDKKSLSLVFDSLKTLNQEDRIVGIISHVEELEQGIDTFITVTKNDYGSDVEASWL